MAETFGQLIPMPSGFGPLPNTFSLVRRSNGNKALKNLIEMPGICGNFDAAFVRVIGEDDLVAIHGSYEGFGPKPMNSIDLFRINELVRLEQDCGAPGCYHANSPGNSKA